MAKNDKAIVTQTPQTMTLDDAANQGLAGMVSSVSAQDIAQKIASGELESAPTLFALEPGQQITCEVVDFGTAIIEDLSTKLPKEVKNWTLRLFHPETGTQGPLISILGSAQLDRMLPPFMGCNVLIARGGTTKTNKGRQLSEYFVGKYTRARPGQPIDTTAKEV